jgi:uncharacterized damage-inducible protein DinB
MKLRDHLVCLYEYEADCTERVIDSLYRARDALEHGGGAAEAAPFIRAVGVFSHIQAARQMWLSRLEQMSPPEEGLFPGWDLPKAASRATSLDTAWLTYVRARQLQGDNLDVQFQYTTTAGVVCRSSVLEILTHVVNHSTYHRGQVASLVAQAGGEPAVTDFILYSRIEAPDGMD